MYKARRPSATTVWQRGCAPLTAQSPVPTRIKLKTIGARPGQSVTSLSKLDHSADRLDWRIIFKVGATILPQVGNTGRILVPERCDGMELKPFAVRDRGVLE